MEKARIRLYDINECGYYIRGSEVPKFGTIDQIIMNLKSWIEHPGRTLSGTSTYEGNNPDGPMRTFCVGVQNCSIDSYLIVTWNEIPALDGKVSSIDGKAPVSKPKIEDTGIPEGHVAGYATYFYFMPSRMQYATIQFNNQLNGNQNLVRYMNGFLHDHSKYCKRSNAADDFKIIGYDEEVSKFDPRNPFLYPKFRSSLFVKGGMIQFIKDNSSSIKKLISKYKITTINEQKLEIYQQILSFLGVSEKKRVYEKAISFKSEFTFTPTINELDSMIATWKEAQSTEKEDDLGFVIEGVPEICWLSHSIVSFERNLDVIRENSQLVNLSSLSTWLSVNHDSLIEKAKQE